jgi:glycosyltransferase involved in cell wall biosynthesis
MKSILMIGLTPPLEGGSERHIFELSKRLENVDVLTQKGSSCERKIELPVMKSSSFMRNISFFVSCCVYSIALLLTVKKKYDVIHIHENLLYFLVPLFKLRYEVVVTVHGLRGFKFHDKKYLWFFFGTALCSADKIVVVSPQDKLLLRNAYYIPNGVDNSIYDFESKVYKKITFIGRIHEQKGLVHLLEAFTRLDNGFKLEIIGEMNDYAKELMEWQRNLSIYYAKELQALQSDTFHEPKNNVIWRGFISDRKEIAKALKSACCIVLPSVWEGLPLTLFEALASGRPVIVSDIPAFRSIINKEAVFFEAGNSRDLEKQMENVIAHNPIGDDGKKLAEQYDWDIIAQKYMEAIQ